MRLFALTLIALALAGPALAALTPEDKKEVEAIVATYIRDNAPEVIKSLQDGQEAAAQAQAAGQVEVLLALPLPVAGKVEAPDVIVVEAFDYNCGYCHRAVESVKALLDSDPGVQVRFVDMPMLASSSTLAAQWAMAADAQGRYWDFHRTLMEHRGEIDEAVLEGAAKALGLDVERARKDAAGPEVAGALAKMQEVAHAMGLRGTPAFIVGGKLYPGYMDAGELKAAVAEARAGAAAK